MWVCATPATQNDGRCEFVRPLPRKMSRRHARPSQVQARHAVPSVPRLPRKTTVDVSLCHACHTNEGGCEFVPCLPRKMPRRPRKMPRRHARPNQVQARHPVPSVPRLPRKTTVDVSLCVTKCEVCVCECECMWNYCMLSLCVCVKLLYVRDGMWQSCVCVWSYCMWEMLRDKVVCVCECVWSYCMWSVTKLCVCVKFCMWSYCMWEMLCDKVVSVCVCERGGGRRRRRSPGYRIKNKNPTQSCGEKHTLE